MFELSEDLNVLASKRVFNAHNVPVNDLVLCKKKNWIISGGADGTISISEIGSGVKVSDFRCTIVPKNIDVRSVLKPFLNLSKFQDRRRKWSFVLRYI